jgi:2-polyprenyl-6-methoxyphenol hydroxylase-like FAD-dependent oxidoreductase
MMSVACAVVGGGPAGMMLGLLLARAGVSVVVLEKHADFLRDFRGDTIHPTTLELMHELGLLEEFLKLPHQKVPRLIGQFGELTVPVADFTHLPTRCKFIAMMPQWDFLDFLARQAARYPAFQLEMRAEATGLIEEAGRVVGVRATTPAGPLEVRADLVVAADGRSSVLREQAGLRVEDLGAPMDVLWFKLSRRPPDPEASMGRFDIGRIFVLINRGQHWQCGYVIPKGAADEVRRRGLDAFRASVAALVPFAAGRVGELRDWEDVRLLTVKVDRLRQWYRPGLLCIGDAAHAMSPVGGVGINLAIQDAVAAANLLWRPLSQNRLTTDHLGQVQRRRQWPTRVIQGLQIAMQRRVINRVLSGRVAPPLFLRLLARYAILRRLPARLIGLGVRAEHIETPAVEGTGR